MKEGTQVRGLNTAATLWASAAVGAFAGTGRHLEAAIVTGFVLAGNTMLRPLVDFVNRRPIAAFDTEALYRVHVVCAVEQLSMARDMLYDELEMHHYPVREIETLAEGDDAIELGAALLPTSVDGDDLDRIVAHISKRPGIISATWTVSTMS
jgi:putative Mg2+ transporter-C (MgtC) family protein